MMWEYHEEIKEEILDEDEIQHLNPLRQMGRHFHPRQHLWRYRND
jgi:hypothetical protein